MSDTNAEGLTWDEWFAAATAFAGPLPQSVTIDGVVHRLQTMLTAEWADGVDPTEWAGYLDTLTRTY